MVKIGQRFARLVVSASLGKTSKAEKLWRCVCDCGNITRTRQGRLLSGQTRSCGCFRRVKHGNRRGTFTSSEYHAWSSMRARCNNPKHAAYNNYGGRGISVCSRWKSFVAFLSDLGQKPSSDLSLERRDVNGNYTPRNCYWATRSEQNKNQRRWL